MKISKLSILFVSLTCILASCSNSKNDTVSVIKHGRSLEYRIHTQEINDLLHLKLSDLVTDFEFIPLETKEECLVSWGGDYYLGEQYYLIEKKGDGILQFNRDGKFIRKIVDVGQGPQEFVDGFWSVDEKNQILYIADEAKRNYFLSFDLFTGAYLGDIPKAVSCRTPQIYSLPNGSILVSTKGNYDKDGLTSYVFCQDANGNILNSIEANATIPVFWSKLTRSNTEQLYSLKMVNNDTIYQILDDTIFPYLTFDTGKENPRDRLQLGHQTFTLNKDVGALVLFDIRTLSNYMKNDKGEIIDYLGGSQHYVLDKSFAKAFHPGSTFWEPIHQSWKGVALGNCRGKYFVNSFDAIYLIDYAEKALANPEFKEPYRSKLKNAVDGLTAESNLVLLVGRYK